MDVITERLKARLHSGSEQTSITREFPSTMITNRCQSVPPPSTSSPFNLQLNSSSIRQEIDTTRSTSTTIQTDLSEHFPESSSGRPLMSNGVNVSELLSSHNDKLRQVQELMTKANHLLETSKEYFTKSPNQLLPSTTLLTPTEQQTSSPRTRPHSASLPRIVETRSSPPPSSSSPKFHTTNGFEIPEDSSSRMISKTDEHER